ncbi:MAG: hypothetical protein DMF59_11385 [Acidobacteria bacterium]|nr:MAG: hypothetical protein DMF59_11385 [Acidobacteriota bacterium]
MRRVLIAVASLLLTASLFASPCDNPYITISGIAGELNAPCAGGVDFISAKTVGNTLTIVKRIDKASVPLYGACVLATPIAEASIVIASQKARYHFTNLIVSSDSQSANPAGETVTLNFAGMDYTDSATAAGAAARPREVNITGTARQTPVAIALVNGNSAQAATTWQASVAGGISTTSIQLQPQITAATAVAPAGRTASLIPTTQCVELRTGSAVAARYVVQGNIPPQGGNLQISKMQIQIPPGQSCAFMTGAATFTIRSR